MDALTKKLLNSLKCPICHAPIDMLNRKLVAGYDFGCAYDHDHYKLALNNGYIAKEKVSLYDKKHKYCLIKEYKDLQTKTTIIIYDVDPENRVRFSFDEDKIVTDLDLFDFRNFNKEKALNRLKTYLVFQ